jgi:hypothetical protein
MPRYAAIAKKDFDYAASEREANRTAVKFRNSGDVIGEMSSAYGHNLAGVQIHTDPQARQLAESHDAEAFTSGRDIFMGAGYRPGTSSGNELLAHEATHVLQQNPTAGAAMESPAPMGAIQRKPTDDDDPFNDPDAKVFNNEIYEENTSGDPKPFYGEEGGGDSSPAPQEDTGGGSTLSEESAVTDTPPQAVEAVAEATAKVLEVGSPVGAVNTVERVGGLPTVMGLRKMAGLSSVSEEKLLKHKPFAAAIEAIDEYHKFADTVVSFPAHITSSPEMVRTGTAIEEALRRVINTSTKAVITFKNSWLLKRSSTCTALTPALASIATRAISLLPRAAGFERAWRTYKAEADVNSATIGEILDSRASAFLSDKSVSTRGDEEQGREAGLSILHAPQSETEGGFRERSGQILDKKIPDFSKKDPADIIKNLRILSNDLRDAAALAATTTTDRDIVPYTVMKEGKRVELERVAVSAGVSGNKEANKHDAQVPYIALAKLLENVMSSQTAIGALISGSASTEEGLAEASSIGISLRSLRGVSLLEAAQRMQDAEYAQNGTIQLETTEKDGAAASEVYLEKAKGFIVRTSKNDSIAFDNAGQGITEEQEKNSMNAYADEAMAKLSRLFKSTVIADARVTKYRLPEGQGEQGRMEHYGSYMGLAKGKAAQKYFATLGRGDGRDAFADMPQSESMQKRMQSKLQEPDPRYRQETLDLMNEKLINEVLAMQVIDFIAASQDRHRGNFFINTEAMNSDDPNAQIVTGIDNDLAFNAKGAAEDYNEGEGMGARAMTTTDGRAYRASKQVELQHGFAMTTQGVKDMVNSISVGQVESTLRPYLGREDLARAVTRYKHLRAHFDSLNGDRIINLSTQEGRDAFRKSVRGTIYNSILDTMKFGEMEKAGTDDIKAAGMNSRHFIGTGGYIGDWLFNSLYDSEAKGAFLWENEGYNMAGLYQMMASLGMTQEEAKQLMTTYNEKLSGDAKASQNGLNKHFQNKHFLENLPSAG